MHPIACVIEVSSEVIPELCSVRSAVWWSVTKMVRARSQCSERFFTAFLKSCTTTCFRMTRVSRIFSIRDLVTRLLFSDDAFYTQSHISMTSCNHQHTFELIGIQLTPVKRSRSKSIL